MFTKKSILTLFLLLITCVFSLWAGDSAVFVDLGFSPDGRTYMFGQYGVLAPSLRPWADIFVVDMASNRFVPNGRLSFTQNDPIKAGQDGSGILYQLLANNMNIANRYSINFQNQGLPLYISRDENPPLRGETIDFRDFVSGRSFKAQLVPTVTGQGQNTRSQFHINLEVRNSNGQIRHYTVGTPNFIRQGIISYNMKRAIVDSTGNSLIFVIEMRRIADNGHDIRYMVEAVRL